MAGESRNSDENRMRSIVNAYSESVYKLAFNRLMSREDAEDVTQNVFIKLFTSEKDFESYEHLRAWLFRVAINCCNDLHRSFWHKAVLRDESAKIAGRDALAKKP